VAVTANASTEAFPEPLGTLGTQWDWVDLRAVSPFGWLRPRCGGRLDDACLKVIARLFDIPQHLQPLLTGEERRRRSTHPLLAAGIAAAMIVSLSVALGWAVVERHQAATQRDGALVSQSRYAAQLARGLSGIGDNGTALALALEVVPKTTKDPDRPF